MLTIFTPVEIEAISDNSYHQKVLRQAQRAGAKIEMGQNGVIRITPRHEKDAPLLIRPEGLPWLGSLSKGGRQ